MFVQQAVDTAANLAPTVAITSLSPVAMAALLALLAFAGWLANRAYDGIKTIFPFFDHLSPVVHQVLAPLFALGFGAVTGATGAPLITNLHGVTGAWLGAVLVPLVQAGVFRADKKKMPVDATVVVADSRRSNG